MLFRQANGEAIAPFAPPLATLLAATLITFRNGIVVVMQLRPQRVDR